LAQKTKFWYKKYRTRFYKAIKNKGSTESILAQRLPETEMTTTMETGRETHVVPIRILWLHL